MYHQTDQFPSVLKQQQWKATLESLFQVELKSSAFCELHSSSTIQHKISSATSFFLLMIWTANRNLDQHLKKKKGKDIFTSTNFTVSVVHAWRKCRTCGVTTKYMWVLIIKVYIAVFPKFSGSKDHIQSPFNSANLAKITSTHRSLWHNSQWKTQTIKAFIRSP